MLSHSPHVTKLGKGRMRFDCKSAQYLTFALYWVNEWTTITAWGNFLSIPICGTLVPYHFFPTVLALPISWRRTGSCLFLFLWLSAYGILQFLQLGHHVCCTSVSPARSSKLPTNKPPPGSENVPPNQNLGTEALLPNPTMPTSYLSESPAAVGLPVATSWLHHLMPPSAKIALVPSRYPGSAWDWTSFPPFHLTLPLAAPTRARAQLQIAAPSDLPHSCS